MKNLLAALFLICGLAARAQTFTPIHNYQQPDGLSVFKYFGIPYGPTPQLNVTRLVPGAIFYNTTDTTMYSWTGTQWIKAGTGGGVVVSPGDGIDSITLRNNTICQWKAGVSTCYDMNLFFTEVELSADRLRLIFYNFMGDSLKTVTLPHTIAEQGAGMLLTRRGDTVNFASTGTGGSGGGLDSVYASISGDTLIFTYSSGRVDRFKFVGASGGISKILPGQYQLAVNDSTTKVDSNFAVIKKEFFNPGVIPFADLSGTGLLTHNFGGLGWDGTNIIIGANDPNTLAGALLNGSRAKIQAWFYGLRFQVGITGDTDPTKEYNFFNANSTTPLLRIHSTGTGPYKHHSIFNTDVIFRDLSTDSTAPTTSGTLKMVVTDAAGKFSWQAIPTPGSSVSITAGLGLSASPSTITGSGSFALDSASAVVLSRARAAATYQPLITGTGFVKSTAGTITYDNSTYQTSNQAVTVTATGDATGTSTASGTAPSIPLVLATVNSNVGSFTNANVTVNAKGLVTAVTNGTSGGVTGLADKAFLYGKSDGTVGQDPTIAYDSITKTLRGGTITSEADYAGKTIVFMGNSVTQGVNASTPYFRYTTVATRVMGSGMVESNLGVTGSKCGDATQINTIPVKTGTMRFLSIAYGINEVPDSATYTHTFFVAAFKKFIDTCIARGWSASDLLINTIPGTTIGLAGYPTYKQREYNAIMDSLHTVYGTMFAESFEYMQIPEYAYITKGILHPDDDGCDVIGQIVAGGIKGNFKMTNQKLAINGPAQLATLILKNPTFLNKSRLMGVDSAGNVGFTYTIQPNVVARGKFFLGGSLIQKGILYPNSYDTTMDILLKANANIQAATNASTKKGMLQMISTSGSTTLSNTFSGGHIYLNPSGGVDGSSIIGMDVAPSGIVDIPKGMKMNFGSSLASNNVSSLIMCNSDFGTDITNISQGGVVRITMSNNVNLSSVQMFQMNRYGRTIFTQGGAVTDITSARLAVNSTTEGFLPPRMTKAQRNAITSGVAPTPTSTITNAGSGYTNGSYTAVALTGGTGSGATATIGVSGNAVTSCTIVSQGSGYTTGDVLGSASITGGSGFALTVGRTGINGLVIYQTDNTPGIRVYDGTTWMKYSETAD